MGQRACCCQDNRLEHSKQFVVTNCVHAYVRVVADYSDSCNHATSHSQSPRAHRSSGRRDTQPSATSSLV